MVLNVVQQRSIYNDFFNLSEHVRPIHRSLVVFGSTNKLRGKARTWRHFSSLKPMPRLPRPQIAALHNPQNAKSHYILTSLSTKFTMAGIVRQPIDVPSLERYISQTVPEIKIPIDLKQVKCPSSSPSAYAFQC